MSGTTVQKYVIKINNSNGKIMSKQKYNEPIRGSCGIQHINECVERRKRREWDQDLTRMDAERSVKISRDLSKDGAT